MDEGRGEDWFFSHQFRALAEIIRCGGIMSMVGATYVLQDILKNKKRRNESIKRIVAAMSISDLICCFIGPFLGSLMIDEAEVQVWGQGTMGNRTTCTIQGFLLTTFVTSSYAYNTTLAVCHLLMVRYGFNDRRLRSLEPYLLYPPFILGLIFAILPLFFQAYHFDSIAGPVCMISAIPIGCDRSDSDTECVQGQYRKILYWTFTGVVCVLNGVTGLSMFLLYRSVLEQQRRGERYSFRRLNSSTLRRSSVRAGRGLGAGLGAGGAAGGRSRRFSLRRSSFVAPRRTLSSTIGRQGLWYSASYFLTLFPSLIVAVISFVFEAKVPYWIAIVAALTLPMLGFANAIVYARPRYVKLRIDFPHLGFGRSVIHTILRTKPPRRQIQQHQQQKKSKQTPANPNQNQNQQLPASATTTTTTTTHTNTSISSSIRNKIHKVLYSMSINLRIFKGESQNKKEQRDVDLDDIDVGVGVGVDVDAEVSSVVAMASKKSKSDLKLKSKENPSKGLKLTFGTKNNADVDVNVHADADADMDAGVIVDVDMDVDVDVEANNKETNVEFDIDVEQANNNETNLDKEDTGTRNNHDDDDHT